MKKLEEKSARIEGGEIARHTCSTSHRYSKLTLIHSPEGSDIIDRPIAATHSVLGNFNKPANELGALVAAGRDSG